MNAKQRRIKKRQAKRQLAFIGELLIELADKAINEGKTVEELAQDLRYEGQLIRDGISEI